ncbi:MAG: FtsW/RodA/SpoVE family cell cycle protein [Atopobiaceae bacterium]|nr:FtsW/RodA/SpoVE family cell cycle protein [Atopobiaceae bacterium]
MIALPLGFSGIIGRRRSSTKESAATPSRIMVPRVVFLVTAFALVLFGLLMIYSSSSIVGLTTKDYGYNPMYFLNKQAFYACVGAAVAVALAVIDYHRWTGNVLRVVWTVTTLLLVLVYLPVAGQDAYGATRWIQIGGFTLQPSEFAKVTIILTGADICESFFWRGDIDQQEALKLALVGVVLPLFLIFRQPDKGTTGVLLLTLLVMSYLSGVSGVGIVLVGAFLLVLALGYAMFDGYARARIITVFNPFNDPYGEGYQLIQGLYAFGSGGITGVGLGFSRQKYNYLPMAHNDFIFAVVGEELGLVGTVGMLLAFAVLLWAGLKIAENAPDLMGRLIAAGCTSLLIIQLLLNVSGVIGIFPLSGKPVPFISYGGSSVISCLMLVGLVISVSLRSTLPETSADRRRAQLRVATEEEGWAPEGSSAGIPTRRTSRRSLRDSSLGHAGGLLPSGSWKVYEGTGGAATRETGEPYARSQGRITRDASGRTRLDLGPSAADRLRSARRRDNTWRE